MMNNLSGYSLGYNIYHIPELVEIIIRNDYNLNDIYIQYWNKYRRFINYINKIGCLMMLKFNQTGFSEFHNIFYKL